MEAPVSLLSKKTFMAVDRQDKVLPKRASKDLTKISWFLQILLPTQLSRWETSTWRTSPVRPRLPKPTHWDPSITTLSLALLLKAAL